MRKRILVGVGILFGLVCLGALRFDPFPGVDIVKVKGLEGIGMITVDSLGRVNSDTSGTVKTYYKVWWFDTVFVRDSTLVWIDVDFTGLNKVEAKNLEVDSIKVGDGTAVYKEWVADDTLWRSTATDTFYMLKK